MRGLKNDSMRQKPARTGRILIARLGALGDTLMATPVIGALTGEYPGRPIDFLCSASAAPLLSVHPGLDRVYGLKQRNWPLLLSPEKLSLKRRLRQRRYDFAVLLESAPHYRRLLESARIGRIRSFRETPFLPNRHSIANNLAAALGGWHGPPPDMELPVSDEESLRAAALLEGLRSPVVGIHVGYGPDNKKAGQAERLKGWRLGNFGHLASMLLSYGASVALTGSRQDAEAVAAVERLTQGPRNRIRNLAGTTGVLRLAGLISRLPLFISVDSGPAHIAAAVKTPLIVLWGPAKFDQVRPVSSQSPVIVIREPVPCAPCYDTPAMKSCRLNICMQRITPGRVAEAALKLL